MMSHTTKPDSSQRTAEMAVDLFDNWFDPIEAAVRARAREFIEVLIRGELDTVLSRPRYGRSQMAGDEESADVTGHRHGSRTRSLTGTFGPIEIAVPRARLNTTDGKTTEWKSQALRAYQRRTLAADALIAGAYLAGTNTRRVRRALAALFGGAVGKDTVESGCGARCRPTGKPGMPARWSRSRSCGLFSTARWCACGSTARRPRSRCSLSSACARTAKRCCSQSKAWRRKHRSLARCPRRSHQARSATARVPHRRRRTGARQGDCHRLGWRAGAAVHSSQAPQPARPCPRAPARGDRRRLQRHDLRGDARGHRNLAAKPSFASGGSNTALSPTAWRRPATGSLLHLSAAEPVAQCAHNKCHRAAARRVQAKDQNPDRAAVGRHCRHAVLGIARIRSDQHAQG